MNKIRYIEYDASHKETFLFDVPGGHDCWLLVITQTPAIFRVDNKYITCEPNTAIFYEPNQPIYYRASEKQYVNDWIRFESDESYVVNSPLPKGVPFFLKDSAYCHKIIQLLVNENILDNFYKEDNTDYLLKVLFNKLIESYGYEKISLLEKKLYQLKEDIYRFPEKKWTLEEMSHQVNVSCGYLQSMYKKKFNISCMDDVIRSRINRAKEYLLYGQFSINEIVSLCGYNTIEHFYRQFKKVTGTTPKTYIVKKDFKENS